MLLTPLALATTAAAALVLPEISEADDGIVSILPIHVAAPAMPSSASAQTLGVPCPRCQGQNSRLELDLSVADGTRLLVNDFELYPNADPMSGDLTAKLVDGADSSQEERLGFSLEVAPVVMDAYQQMQLIDVDLRILQVGDRYLDGIPTVKLQLIKAITQDITIANVGLLEEGPARCSALACRARQMVGKMLQALKSAKGCAMGQRQRGPRPSAPGDHSDAVVSPIHVDRPDESAEASPEQPAKHHPDWRLLLKNVASHIFLPVLMGVTAGVGVAVLAMVLCSVAIRLTECVKGKRAQRSSCCHKKRASRQPTVAAEKVGLMDEEANSEQGVAGYRDDETKN